MSREIMQQALGALKLGGLIKKTQAIAALEAELAKPEQEFKYTEYGLRGDENGKLSIGEIPRKPWVGLTDEDTANICMQSDLNNWHDEQVIDAVETKLKDKNA